MTGLYECISFYILSVTDPIYIYVYSGNCK